jgi:hypothetical protein
MYGFLILLPLTLISAVIGWLIGTSAQVGEYVTYITDISAIPDVYKEALNNQRVWMRIGAHVVAYVILSFTLVATVRTISAPLPSDRPALLRVFQLILEMIFVAVPTLVLLKINGYALLADPGNPVHMLTVALLGLGLIVTVMLTATRRPLELYATFDTPFSLTKTDIGASTCLVLGAALIAGFALFPIEAATIVGMFPVLMLATSVAFLMLAAIFSRNASPVAVISAMITTVMALNVVDRFLPPREFRHTNLPIVAPAQGTELSVAEVKAKRNVPKLSDAFLAWLQARKPAIDAYREKGRVYPIFFASAQGGGMYAAYHPALALARLTDACPEFPQHLFGISSVSGGSLGAAVYAELLRTLPKAPEYETSRGRLGCSATRGPKQDNYLQSKVEQFFTTDFLSPVVASAFIYDLPSLLIPQLRFGQDRARALEHGFEVAFAKLGAAVNRDGLSQNFLERWQPGGVAPALFMSTTGVNFGIPVLVSQIDWSYSASRFVPATSSRAPTPADLRSARGPAAPTEAEILETVRRKMENPNDGLQVGVGNILDFRPDIQLATSTAVVLSARFPFVTPPGAIADSAAIKPNPLYQKTQVLELTDGAFYDNSGAIVARDIVVELVRMLDRDERFREFKDAVRFELIRFTDTPAKRHSEASQGVHFELVTPLVAYDAVRQSRGVLLPNPPQGVPRHEIYLLDEWYEGTLNWLLTRETKAAIEKRASWLLYDNDVCCEVTDPKTKMTRRVPLKPPQEVEAVKKAGYEVKTFIPNAGPFNNILRLVSEGGTPRPSGNTRATPPPPSPEQPVILPPPPELAPVRQPLAPAPKQ